MPEGVPGFDLSHDPHSPGVLMQGDILVDIPGRDLSKKLDKSVDGGHKIECMNGTRTYDKARNDVGTATAA